MSGPGLKVRSPDEQPLWDQFGTNKTDAARSRGESPFGYDTGGSMGMGADEGALEVVAKHMKAGPEKDHVLTSIARHIAQKQPELAAAPVVKKPSVSDGARATKEALFAQFGPGGPGDFQDDPMAAPGGAPPAEREMPERGSAFSPLEQRGLGAPVQQAPADVPPVGPGASNAQIAGNLQQFNQITAAQPGASATGLPVGWGLPPAGGDAGGSVGEMAAQAEKSLGGRDQALDAKFAENSKFGQNTVDANPDAQIHGGRVREMVGAREERQAQEERAGNLEQQSGEAFGQSVANWGEQRKDTQSLLDEQAKQQKFVQDKTEFLASQMTDLMSRKVDPGRLWNHGGQMAAVGAAISDAINSGVSWLYGKSPNEMGSQMDKVQALIEADTNQQQEAINSGRANLNAGGQMLAQMQNVYQSQGAAKAALMMQKWQASKDLLTARLQKLTDTNQIAAAKSAIGECDKQMGALAIHFGQETKAAAAAAAAAQRSAYEKDREFALKTRQVANEEYKAETERMGKDGEGDKDLESKSVPIPAGANGEERRMMVGSPENARHLADLTESIDKAHDITEKAIAIKTKLRDADIGIPEAMRLKAELEKLNAQAVLTENKGSGAGAMDAGVQPYYQKMLSATEPSSLQAYGGQLPRTMYLTPGGAAIKAGAGALSRFSSDQDITRMQITAGEKEDALARAYKYHGGTLVLRDPKTGKLYKAGMPAMASPPAQGMPDDAKQVK